MKFSLEQNKIDLINITNKIICSTLHCNNTLVFVNDDVFLLKSAASVIDIPQNRLVVKCPNCKTFNIIKISELNQKDTKSLLVV